MSNNMENFTAEFLDSYLKFGLGSMPKSDIDALAMSLLEKYGIGSYGPLASMNNQRVSEILRTPVSRVKKLRYDAALKYGGSIEDQAKARLLATIAKATFEPEGDDVCLIIEDSLAKTWLQGKLKEHQQIFDHSFNTEIVRVSSTGFFSVLRIVFEKQHIQNFEAAYYEAKKAKDVKARKEIFKKSALEFAVNVASAATPSILASFNALYKQLSE